MLFFLQTNIFYFILQQVNTCLSCQFSLDQRYPSFCFTSFFFLQQFFFIKFSFRKKKMSQKRLSEIVIFLTLIIGLTISNQFQQLDAPIPFPKNSYIFVSISEIRMQALVNGALEYYHVGFQDANGNDKPYNDTSLHRPNNYSFISTDYGTAIQYVYASKAPGLVKVQMAIFSNGIKKKQLFSVTAQLDRSYSFFEFYSNASCVMFTEPSFAFQEDNDFVFFYSQEDALSSTLPKFPIQRNSFNLLKPGKYYLRIKFNPNNYISSYGPMPMMLQTIPERPCLNSCPYSQAISSVSQTTSDICSCLDGVYDMSTKSCVVCTQDSIETACTAMITQTCGNGIREGSQECDNDNQAGCINCIKEAGYQCRQNEFNRTKCQKCGNGVKEITEECDNENKTGCKNCKIEMNYFCQEDIYRLSLCYQCGNRVKEGKEQCDNKNQAGCTNCQIQYGYNCTGDLFSASKCFTDCGDGIKAGIQACDNKNQVGCRNCQVQNGYTCREDEQKYSTCQLIQNNIDSGCAVDECNKSQKIIIGVCVGVGSGFAVTAALGIIYCKLSNKKYQAQIGKTSQPNIDPSDERIESKETMKNLQEIV